MKKIMIAALGLSLLPGAAIFAQNTSNNSTMQSTDTTSTTTTKHKHKSKKNKNSSGSTMSSTTSDTTSSPK